MPATSEEEKSGGDRYEYVQYETEWTMNPQVWESR